MNREAEILFYQLADLTPDEQKRYFDSHNVPPELRAEVTALLECDARTDHSLTMAVGGCAEELVRRADETPPERCGPYRLERLLGRGGMGVVYLAERSDGEVEQQVAIKLLSQQGSTPSFRDRFLRERQILATLNHPGIARLLDVGHSAEGRPYLAMDYIDGVPIDVYAEKLDLQGKLALFLRVCDAVSYAHRNLIVHRDLKPSNILVDAMGQPKLLDFGIAKILEEGVEQTVTQERLLTPEYASPEQVRGTIQTTTSDLYSLAAVLYRLLTGQSPHALSGSTAAAIETAICTTAPVVPSRVNSTVPRDLDFILGKALRKEPEERYSSVDALAEDIRAFLESRPVRARSGNTWYRTRKFLRRYRVPVAAALLASTGLAIGLFVANRERAVAQHRFMQVRRLANKVLALDNEIRFLPGSTKAREEIVAMSQEYLAGLASEAPSDPDLALEIGRGYTILARAQGVPMSTNLGRADQAAISLAKADALIEPVVKKSPANKVALFYSADVAHLRMILADSQRRRDEALAQAAKAAARLDAFLSPGPPTESERSAAYPIYDNIALVNKNEHRYDDAVRYARRAIEVGRSGTGWKAMIASSLSVLADSLRLSGDLDGALVAIRQARGELEHYSTKRETARLTSLYNVLWREGVILGQDGSFSLERPNEAVASFQKAFDLMDGWAQKDPDDWSPRSRLFSVAHELGRILEHQDPGRALEIYGNTISRLNDLRANKNAREAIACMLADSCYALRQLRREAEAGQRIETAMHTLRETKAYPAARFGPDEDVAIVLHALADHLAATGQSQRAAATYLELLRGFEAFHMDPHNDLAEAAYLSNVYVALAAVDRRIGKENDAALLDARRMEIWKHWQERLPGSSFIRRQLSPGEARPAPAATPGGPHARTSPALPPSPPPSFLRSTASPRVAL